MPILRQGRSGHLEPGGTPRGRRADENGAMVGHGGADAVPDARPCRALSLVEQPWPEETRSSPRAHREQVVRRLLLRGLSPRVLGLLLPEWRPLIDRVARL